MLKRPNPLVVDMATKTHKKKAKIDTEQICALIKHHLSKLGRGITEKHLLDAVCKNYNHPRYQRKPTPSSLRACVRREYRKTLLVAKPVKQESKYADPHHFNKTPLDWDRYNPKPSKYDEHKPSKTPQPVTLKAVTRLTEKTANELAKSVLRLKALNEEKGKLLRTIADLDERKAVLEAFNNDPQTLKILSWLNE